MHQILNSLVSGKNLKLYRMVGNGYAKLFPAHSRKITSPTLLLNTSKAACDLKFMGVVNSSFSSLVDSCCRNNLVTNIIYDYHILLIINHVRSVTILFFFMFERDIVKYTLPK